MLVNITHKEMDVCTPLPGFIFNIYDFAIVQSPWHYVIISWVISEGKASDPFH